MESRIAGEFAKIFLRDYGSHKRQVLVLLEPSAATWLVRVMTKPEGHRFRQFEVAFPYTANGKAEAVAYWGSLGANKAWSLVCSPDGADSGHGSF